MFSSEPGDLVVVQRHEDWRETAVDQAAHGCPVVEVWTCEVPPVERCTLSTSSWYSTRGRTGTLTGDAGWSRRPYAQSTWSGFPARRGRRTDLFGQISWRVC